MKTTFAVSAIHVFAFIAGLFAIALIVEDAPVIATVVAAANAFCLELLAIDCTIKSVKKGGE